MYLEKYTKLEKEVIKQLNKKEKIKLPNSLQYNINDDDDNYIEYIGEGAFIDNYGYHHNYYCISFDKICEILDFLNNTYN